MVPDAPSSAEGDFEQTPFAHLAVYALDRKLTGELFLIESDEVAHAIAFRAGAPTKIKMGNGLHRLGDVLVEEGLVERDKVEGAALTGGLLGDVLVLAGCVETEGLNRALDLQFLRRMAYFYALPPSTKYKYFDQSDTLADWGADPTSLDPLGLIWKGLRDHADASSHYAPTLERLGDGALSLHAKAPLHRLELEEDVKTAAEVLSIEPTTLGELEAIEGADAERVRRLVYALTILRQLDLGRGGLPVGVEERTQSLAKVQLRSQAMRVGVALDHPGDGERSVRAITVRGRAVIPRDDDSAPPPPSGVSGDAEEPKDEAIERSSAVVSEVEASGPEAPILETTMAEIGEDELEPSTGDSAPPAASPEPAAPSAPEKGEPAAAKAAAPEEDAAEESSRRLVTEAIRAMPNEALLKLAKEKLAEKEASMAAAVAELAVERMAKDGDTTSDLYCQLVAYHAQARSLEPHPDLKALALSLDEVVRARDDLPIVRFTRGQIRKRLGNESGFASDMRRVLELDPGHEGAKKAVEQEAAKLAKPAQAGFLKRLFGR